MISYNQAVCISTVLFSLFLLFHSVIIILILFFGIAPTEMLWGGRMKTSEELLAFEVISWIIQIFCLAITLIHTDYIKLPTFRPFAKYVLWALSVLFVVNTVGNLFATSWTETLLFTPVTAVLAVCCYRMATNPVTKQKQGIPAARV